MSKKYKKEKVRNASEKVEEYLKSRYNFRYNIVLGKVEYEDLAEKIPQELDDYKINSILRELKRVDCPIGKGELIQILRSDFTPRYDPFLQYFHTLPAWDGQTNFIEMLSETVNVAEDEKEQWKKYLRKWLIGVVACAINPKDVNHSVLVFVGKQSVGKTQWMDRLVPSVLHKYYYSGDVNPGDKDSKVNLAECLLINLDELGCVTKGEIEAMKQMVTLGSIRVRRPYAAVPETLQRRASFMGSVNNYEFLRDTTGNRRFLCVEALAIEYDYQIDINMVYSQAYHLLMGGEKHWFNYEENQLISAANEKYKVSYVELEYVNEFYRPCKEDETPEKLLTTTGLQRDLLPKKNNKLQNLNIRNLGIALKASNYERTKQNGVWKWKLMLKSKDK